MLVFIDESGDAGFKIGSSSSLVMALVIFDDHGEADKTRDRITQMMQQTGVKPEYKFSRCNHKNKESFFTAITSCHFRVRAIVMRKSCVHSDFLRKHPDQFYNYTLKTLISHNDLANARIRIDGKGNSLFIKAAKSYLRRQTPPGIIANVKFLDSKAEPLIQLSDMVTGAIARAHNAPDNPDAIHWQRIIRAKIENVWDFF